jgi:cation:H+ antiporter
LNGALWIAEVTGVPRFIIGATVVSVATTLPELTVSVTGVLEGEADLAVGNAVGSVTANLGLILGLSALCVPSAAERRSFAPKAGLMAGAAALLALLCARGRLPALPSLLLGAVFAAYLVNSLRDARPAAGASPAPERPGFSRRQVARRLAPFALGAAGILIGSRLLIRYGSDLARALGVPAGIVGVTLVAVGTSLPELVTTLTAISRKEASLSVGNIIGANIIDLTLILPVCALLSGGSLTISRRTVALDLPVCLALTAAAVLPPLLRGRFYRWQGAALLALYAAYVAVLVT